MKPSMAAALVVISWKFVIFVSAQSSLSEEFSEKSEKCFQQQRVPQAYKAKFQAFQFPDEEIVHKYIHCLLTELNIWDINNGFNVERIYPQYLDTYSAQIYLPVISKCYEDNQNRNKELWCYRSFLCILNTQVGGWFKDNVRSK